MELLESARLVSLGQTAASVAHELNQPLSAISNTAGDIYLSLTEETDLPRAQLQQMMESVLGLVKRMAGTIAHLGIFSRESAQETPEPFSMNDVVGAALRMVETQLENHGIVLEVNLVDGMPEVEGYPTQLEQVVLNLISNARDALDEAGEGGPERVKHLHIRTLCDAEGNAVVEVEDSGTGIDPAHQDQVLRPFFTTKEAGRGTGLGLSISYAIVRHHNGRMSFESEKGKGSTFRVVLPPEA
jgi:signal transduction histidine kinase